jgi:hypothetical protein
VTLAVREYWAVKFADTVFALLMVTVQVAPLALSQPDQLLNV